MINGFKQKLERKINELKTAIENINRNAKKK